MQGHPIDYEFSAAHTEKTAEIDHGSAHLPALIDEDIDDTELTRKIETRDRIFLRHLETNATPSRSVGSDQDSSAPRLKTDKKPPPSRPILAS